MGDLGQPARVVGIDIARALALVGMMAVHILPAFDHGTDDLTLAHHVAGGRASALFAVLAGVSLALTTGRTLPVRGRPFVGAAVGVAVRAALIALLGLALGELDSGIAVILTQYGVLFLLGIPFLMLRARSLLALGAAWVLIAPVVAQVVRRHLPDTGFQNPTIGMLQDPVLLLNDLTFTGVYPVVPWMSYLLVGMALGRTDLTRRRAPVWIAAAGAVLVTVAVLTSDALLRRPGVMRELSDRVGGPWTLDRSLAAGFFGTTPAESWLVARGPGPAHLHALRPRPDDRERVAGDRRVPGAGPAAPVPHARTLRRRRDHPDSLHGPCDRASVAVGRRHPGDLVRSGRGRPGGRCGVRRDAPARAPGGGRRCAEPEGQGSGRRVSGPLVATAAQVSRTRAARC